MTHSTLFAGLLATPPFCLLPIELFQRLFEPLREMAELIHDFRISDPTPESAWQFEQMLNRLLREIGRRIVEWVYNDIEPPSRDLLPTRLHFAGTWYQRNSKKTANRDVATLFGTITLMRFLYRPFEEGGPSIFPVEICLGLESGRATPALADRVAQYAAHATQQTVLDLLKSEHNVQWSVDLLRKVTASVSRGMQEHRHEAQVAKVLSWLKKASTSRGSRKPILSVGRDGIFMPIRHESCYREGAVGTVSVLDRKGRRLGTVYLGRMPEPGQSTLSDQLTALIQDVLTQWAGPMPRLVYVTDAGHHPTEYYENVLCRMAHPHHPGEWLAWEWVVDYYHACQYVSKLSEALFGPGKEAHAWAAKMRRWLKNKPRGIYRVLHSAAALYHRKGLEGSVADYEKAYNYLRTRIQFLDYVDYRKRHLPIGSGVTEAACKTVFTQRMKQSGMSWGIDTGQTIVDLRVLHLSGVWAEVRAAYLSAKPSLNYGTRNIAVQTPLKIAA